jgi:putative tryptophan/tyrosine transport system substrate-binding protein
MKNHLFKLALGAMAFAICVSAEAQQPAREVPRVGILFIGDRNQPHLEAFKQGLRERGYIEGKNIAIESAAMSPALQPLTEN